MENTAKECFMTGFYKKPYALNKQGLSRTTASIASLISSFSVEGKNCAMSYTQIGNIVGASRPTVHRSIKLLESKGYISRERCTTHTIYQYLFPNDIDMDTYMRVENWLASHLFYIDGKYRTLTKAEIDVYCLIYTHSLNKKNKLNEYVGSDSLIAGLLRMSRSTAAKAIKVLLKAKLIYRTTAQNGHEKSRFTVNRKYVREIEKKQREEKKTTQVTPEQQYKKQQIKAIDERTDVERWYASRRAQAEAVVDRNEKRALENPEYKAVVIELNNANREAAKADAFGLGTLPDLLQRVKELEVKRLNVLTGMGMTEQDFIPQYHCKKCSDTGFLSDGRACGCYKK